MRNLRRTTTALFRFFLILFLSQCASSSWIRTLPYSGSEISLATIPAGLYVRNRPERSHRNTLYYKNIVHENILLNSGTGRFEKSTRREIKDKNEYRTTIVVGKGIYSVSGNWVLLETQEKAELSYSGNSEPFQVEYAPFSHKLLYHYDSETKTLVPLLYETGYEEKSYGLLDGMSAPYAEDRFFAIARRNLLKKEFQFHAYFYKP
ncbi:hypothetical protein EHQ12_14955 [Leptospira gomenensis]|uniref:Lipoprotein n=1 Tax=Leptospira gomenensis TaxID=2484974 RepID=A0A5F1YC24_9LEPT|nr:hypothetical protein [Leptospira gomenensis]TGK35155.1 hypothetical protein EHQ17_06865 [Leptospira gomenensis]TGK35861.1 hypothetical protein EHQ12_14955 [Leptospira gomenensis]TGK41017.1 hypothetical protein EHQ07_16625 [Leptospira gomenensis]TGK61246.1 hypothetical protein EHQ13_09305 [Leptospira gomenensis]